MYKNYFYRIFLIGISMSLLVACDRKKSNNSDQSTIAELEEQLNKLQETTNNEQATTQISELQQQITALQQQQGVEDPQITTQITTQINALKSQIAVLQAKNAQISELQKQINELSKKTIDGSVILACSCFRPLRSYRRDIESSGTNKADALQNASDICKRIQANQEDAYVTDCTVKN